MKFLYHLQLLFAFTFCHSSDLFSQNSCDGSFNEYYLNSNNIRASFFPRGNKFTDGNAGGFLAPYDLSRKTSTIFASSPWIGGFDDAGNLKIAVETYPNYTSRDYHVGPLDQVGVPYELVCKDFDKAWSIYAEDIYKHILDYQTDFKIDDTISSIFGWPSKGNKFFSTYNGFELPDGGDQGYAAFFDYNQNGSYDPEKGDYPIVRMTHANIFIPDQILWMVFHDVGTPAIPGTEPLRIELQLTAYAFHCQNNEILNNTIFNSYKLINHSLTSKDSVFFGMWADYDLGCGLDDFPGSDSTRNTEFVYNVDDEDGDIGTECSYGAATYGNNVPVQSFTYLSHPMHSFISYSPGNESGLELYRLLNGMWSDGTFMRPEGDGYAPSSALPPTKFLFNGDPRDPLDWAARNVFSEGRNAKNVSSVSLGRFDPGTITQVDMAYMFHHEPGLTSLEQVSEMYENVDSLLASIWKLDDICDPYPLCIDDDCVWPGDFDHNGIADHRDYIMWGLVNGTAGHARNGVVSWRAHRSEDWDIAIAGINYKHADGDGNGIIDIRDIDVNTEHFLLSNDRYDSTPIYHNGDEILLTSQPFLDSQGGVGNLKISAGVDLENIIGLAFELEYDTSLYSSSFLLPGWPDGAPSIEYITHDITQHRKIAFVQTNNTGIDVEQNFAFIRSLGSSLRLKDGASIPDSTVLRLRNLIGRNANGQDMQLGSNRLVIYKDAATAVSNPTFDKISIYPNPVHEELHIEGIENVDYEIINAHGKFVAKGFLNSTTIDVSPYPAGFYMLRFPSQGIVFKIVVH